MNSPDQILRPHRGNIFATKLRGIQLKIKKLCVERGIAREQLEDSSSGLNLLIEENELQQRLHESSTLSSNLSKRSTATVVTDISNDNHVGSAHDQPSSSHVCTITDLPNLQQISANVGQIPVFDPQHCELTLDQMHSIQSDQLRISENTSPTRGDHAIVSQISNSPDGNVFVIPQDMPPVLGVQDQLYSQSSGNSEATILSTFPSENVLRAQSHVSNASETNMNVTGPDLCQCIRRLPDSFTDTTVTGHSHVGMVDVINRQSLDTNSGFQQSHSLARVQEMPPPQTIHSSVFDTGTRVPNPQRPNKARTRYIMPKPQSSVMADESVSLQLGTQNRRIQKQKPRGPFRNSILRKETAETRATGACERCHRHKERCGINQLHPHGPCLRCLSARTICIRWKIAAISLFRDQAAPWPLWTRRWLGMEKGGNIDEWADNQLKSLHISHRNPATGRAINAEYTVEVRRFIPELGDMLYQDWFDMSNGQHKKHPIQPYAVTNLNELTTELNSYITRSIIPFIIEIVGHADSIIWRTYKMACQRCQDIGVPSQEQKLLFKVLRLWTTARIASLPEDVQGDDKIADRVDDNSSPYYDTYPVAPVIYAQEEIVNLTRIQRPLQREVLAELDAVMKEAVLSPVDETQSMQRSYNYRTEILILLQTKFANPEAINSNENGIISLISQFHCDNMGFIPFDMVLDLHRGRELAESAKLDSVQLQLVRDTSETARDRMQEFHTIRSTKDLTNEYYFISQLFSRNNPQMATT